MPFTFSETMAGSFRPVGVGEAERPLSFSLRAESNSLPRFAKDPYVRFAGEIDAPGLADRRPIEGTLGMDLVRTGKLPYDFRFTGNDGRRYRFVGEKTVSLRSLVTSMTDLPGAILDDAGHAIATAFVRFDLRRDLVSFLRTWKYRPSILG
jgi:hypothetical protein